MTKKNGEDSEIYCIYYRKDGGGITYCPERSQAMPACPGKGRLKARVVKKVR